MIPLVASFGGSEPRSELSRVVIRAENKIENMRLNAIRQFAYIFDTEGREILVINHQYMLQSRVQYSSIYNQKILIEKEN